MICASNKDGTAVGLAGTAELYALFAQVADPRLPVGRAARTASTWL
jgi:hypothetical protein